MPGLRLLPQDVVPLLDNGHLLDGHAVLLKQAGIVKGDPPAAVALNQRGVDVVHVLLRQIALLERIPYGEPGDFLRQQGLPALGTAILSCVGRGFQTANVHQADTIRGGRPQLDKLAAHRLAQGTVLMALFGDNVDHLPLLLPKPLADALKQGGLARSAVAERGKVAVGVFVVIVQVDEYRRAVVEV